MNNLNFISILSALFVLGLAAAMDKKNWMYEFTSVTTKSSNSNLINVKLSVERIKRGIFALSGEFYVNLDIKRGDGNEIELTSFRSSHGNGDFKSLPFEMSRRHFYDALNTHYKDVLMETFKECTDLPYFEDEFPEPLEMKTYYINKCQISQDGLPNHLESGTYMIVLSGYGDAEWNVEVIVEVEPSYE